MSYFASRARSQSRTGLGAVEFHVIGMGRVGSFLAQAVCGSGGRQYRRADSVAAITGRAVVAVRIADMDQLLTQLPQAIKGDLVMVQNGIYETILLQHQVVDVTKIVAYFAVSQVGDTPQDELGMSVVTGKYSTIIQSALARFGLSVRIVNADEWWVVAHEKLIWLSVFGLLGELFELKVGLIVTHHEAEVRRLIVELGEVCTQRLGLEFKGGVAGLITRQMQYTQSISDFRSRLKEYSYRNGYFTGLQPTEFHTQLLNRVGIH